MIPQYLEKLFGPNWRTTTAAAFTVACGFIAFSPELFHQWPALIRVAQYAALGGVAKLGISAADAKNDKPQS